MRGKKKKRLTLASVVEEVVFGVEDSLVSTVGALTGIAAGTQNTYVVVLAGVVLIFAEALSMTAGSYLSSKAEAQVWLKHHTRDWEHIAAKGSLLTPIKSVLKKLNIHGTDRKEIISAVEKQNKRWVQQVLQHEHANSPAGNKGPVVAAFVMGTSYLMAGIIPLGSYLLLPVEQAIIPSVVVTAIALFAFGVWKANLVGGSKLKSGGEMVLVAMSAATIAFLLGLGVRMMFGL